MLWDTDDDEACGCALCKMAATANVRASEERPAETASVSKSGTVAGGQRDAPATISLSDSVEDADTPAAA